MYLRLVAMAFNLVLSELLKRYIAHDDLTLSSKPKRTSYTYMKYESGSFQFGSVIFFLF